MFKNRSLCTWGGRRFSSHSVLEHFRSRRETISSPYLVKFRVTRPGRRNSCTNRSRFACMGSKPFSALSSSYTTEFFVLFCKLGHKTFVLGQKFCPKNKCFWIGRILILGQKTLGQKTKDWITSHLFVRKMAVISFSFFGSQPDHTNSWDWLAARPISTYGNWYWVWTTPNLKIPWIIEFETLKIKRLW